MENRRKIDRHYLLSFMCVSDATTNQPIGDLVDITLRGARIVGQEPIPEGQAMRLRLALSSEITEKPFIEFPARSRWCLPDIDPSRYNIGFEILELSPEDSAILQKIINMHGFQENKAAV